MPSILNALIANVHAQRRTQIVARRTLFPLRAKTTRTTLKFDREVDLSTWQSKFYYVYLHVNTYRLFRIVLHIKMHPQMLSAD